MISCHVPVPAKKRFYHLSRFHTRVSLTWLCFLCVCRSQIVREHLVRKRPDGQAGKWSSPWGNKVLSLALLPQGARVRGLTDSDAGGGTSNLAQSCRNLGHRRAFLQCREQEILISMLQANRMKSDTTLPMLWKWTQSSLWIGVSLPQSLTMQFSLPIPRRRQSEIPRA